MASLSGKKESGILQLLQTVAPFTDAAQIGHCRGYGIGLSYSSGSTPSSGVCSCIRCGRRKKEKEGRTNKRTNERREGERKEGKKERKEKRKERKRERKLNS